MLIFIGLIILFVLILVIRFLRFKKIVKLFENENVSCCGLRGTGKDTTFAGYLSYTKKCDFYISPFDYKIKGKTWIPLDLKKIDIKNDYKNFIENNINKYVYPYPERAPILIPDAQEYFPSYMESKLKKEYPGITNYPPLSRHLGDNQVHYNSQYSHLVWDKLRVQSGVYLRCMSCRYIFHKFVFINYRIYEREDSFLKNIPPYRAPRGRFKALARNNTDIAKMNYIASYGKIEKMKCFFISKSKYNSRYFKELLENGNRN